MCCGCWEEEGKTIIDNERVRAVQPLIQVVYDFSCVGGNLHIVLDDNNLEDDSLEFCEGCIGNTTYHVHDEDPQGQWAAERACLAALKAMTYDERVSALGLWDGCWTAVSHG